jgi:hypothetical protein
MSIHRDGSQPARIEQICNQGVFGCGVLENPTRLCEPSQKGLFSEWPHLQSQT